ncbi:MAG: ferrochelatase, partial [Rhizomicrobium sp.]
MDGWERSGARHVIILNRRSASSFFQPLESIGCQGLDGTAVNRTLHNSQVKHHLQQPFFRSLVLKEKLGIVLFNLGGPDCLEAVEPFLRNLFSDPAIIALPSFLRQPLARMIARRRSPTARAIYREIGGRSPIRGETERQARALEEALTGDEREVKVQVAMRCWHPMSDEAANALKGFAPDRIVLLPLYPQFSTTTSGSSFKDWDRAACRAGLSVPSIRICCYPIQKGFIAALAASVRAAMAMPKPGVAYRLLFSAHGLPKR